MLRPRDLTPDEMRRIDCWNEGNTAPEVAKLLGTTESLVYVALARARLAGVRLQQRKEVEARTSLPRLSPAEVDARMDILRLQTNRPASPRARQPWVSIFDRVPDPLEQYRRGEPAMPEMAQRFR
ncbi:hypothetical protein [Roseomonas elaeocarpi]|uniref:Helix-turn-helix domain-containing protein n=1 Tax=Roseomonas elaeocarpi TaxID=907779 RepID=A0ABV6K0G0_9PROT